MRRIKWGSQGPNCLGPATGRVLAFILGVGKWLEGLSRELTFSSEDENCGLSVLCFVTSQHFILFKSFLVVDCLAERPLTDNPRSTESSGLRMADVVILRQKENADPRPSVQFPSKAACNDFHSPGKALVDSIVPSLGFALDSDYKDTNPDCAA